MEGDYRSPPPKGAYDQLHDYSKKLMKRDPVRIAIERQQFVLDEVVAKLIELGIFVVIAILDDHHLHLLARFPDHNPRKWLGRAKKHASHMIGSLPDVPAGGLWAKRSKAEPVVDRDHQLNVVKYLLEHWERGAALWILPSLRGREEQILKFLRAQKKAHG